MNQSLCLWYTLQKGVWTMKYEWRKQEKAYYLPKRTTADRSACLSIHYVDWRRKTLTVLNFPSKSVHFI